MSGIPLKKSTICVQWSLITTTRVATAATIPATTAATKAGAPRITAPTAAMAIPITIRASFTQLKPSLSIPKKFVTAMTVPPITAPIPAMVGPMLEIRPAIFEIAGPTTAPIFVNIPDMVLTSVPNEPVTFVTIPASFGNSRARTSLNVPAPPDNNWNPSTTFGTMPMMLLAVFPKPPSTLRRLLTPPTTSEATFSAATDAAMVPIALPSASMVSGSAPSRAEKILLRASTTVWAIGASVDAKPSNNPLKKAPRPGNSCSIPVINPWTICFPTSMI